MCGLTLELFLMGQTPPAIWATSLYDRQMYTEHLGLGGSWGLGSVTSTANQRKFQHFSERKDDILHSYRLPKNLLWIQMTTHVPWVAIDLFKVTNTYSFSWNLICHKNRYVTAPKITSSLLGCVVPCQLCIALNHLFNQMLNHTYLSIFK